MSQPRSPKSWSVSSWLKKHFSNRFFDRYANLLALSEGTMWSIQHTLNQIVTFVKPKAAKRCGKPKIPNFLPRLEPLETRQMLTAYTWGGGSGNWSTTTNWTPNGDPGSSDTVTISSGTVVVDSSVTVGGFTFSGGTVELDYTLTLAGSSSWTGGSFQPVVSPHGPEVHVASTATLSISSGSAKSIGGDVNLLNYGTVNWTSDNIAISAAEIINESGGIWTMANSVGFTDTTMYDNTFYNDGTLNLGGVNQMQMTDFAQSSSGILVAGIEQVSGSLYDQLELGGSFLGGGTLEVEPLPGLNVNPGDVFPVLTASGIADFAGVDIASGFSNSVGVTYTGSTDVNAVIGGAATLSTGTSTATTQVAGSGNVSLLTGNLNIQVAAAVDYTPLEEDDLYYYPGLEYDSDTASPTPLIGVSLPTLSTDPALSDIKATLTWNGTAQTPVTFSMPVGSTPGDTYDFAVQVASPVSTTKVYSYSIAVEEDYSGSSTIQTLTGTAFVVVNGSAPTATAGR